MIVLVTGFEPYLGARRNPTQALALAVNGRRVGRAEIVGRVLPTEFRRSAQMLVRLLREVRPNALLMFGLAPRKRLAIECVALNIDHGEQPDCAGERRWRRLIDRMGPWVAESRVPIDRVYHALRRARIPAALSYHAGTYVCNHAFYVALRKAKGIPVGFFHVPPGRSLLQMIRAVDVIVRAVR